MAFKTRFTFKAKLGGMAMVVGVDEIPSRRRRLLPEPALPDGDERKRMDHVAVEACFENTEPENTSTLDGFTSARDEPLLGLIVTNAIASAVGLDGRVVGAPEGEAEGVHVGWVVGDDSGCAVGNAIGSEDGCDEGAHEGPVAGCPDGSADG